MVGRAAAWPSRKGGSSATEGGRAREGERFSLLARDDGAGGVEGGDAGWAGVCGGAHAGRSPADALARRPSRRGGLHGGGAPLKPARRGMYAPNPPRGRRLGAEPCGEGGWASVRRKRVREVALLSLELSLPQLEKGTCFGALAPKLEIRHCQSLAARPGAARPLRAGGGTATARAHSQPRALRSSPSTPVGLAAADGK